MTTATVTPETAEWIDGVKFVDWLRQNGLENARLQLGLGHEGALSRWRKSGRASVWAADRVLTKLNLHLSEIPDDLWLDDRTKAPL